MALLNGECGGTLSIGLTHSPLYETGEDGSIVKTPVPFAALIKTLVHEYGGIPENKIIIDNIPERIKNIVRWTGGYPIYGYESPQGENIKGKTLVLTTAIPAISKDWVYDTFSFGDSLGL